MFRINFSFKPNCFTTNAGGPSEHQVTIITSNCSNKTIKLKVLIYKCRIYTCNEKYEKHMPLETMK